MSEQLTESLVALIGKAKLVQLAERFGGRRLYVPQAIDADHEIAQAIGTEAAARLVRLYARCPLRIPLARELRARQYRAEGRSNGEIATALGMTETGVDKLFSRMASPPQKGSTQLQLKL